MDELQGLREMFSAIPDPGPTAIQRARQKVSEQATPSRSLPYRTNRLAVTAVAAACLALAGVGVVAVNGHAAPDSGPAASAGAAASAGPAVKTMSLAGYVKAATQALKRQDYIIKSSQRMPTPTGVEDSVTWETGTGGPNHQWRIENWSTSGRLLYDMAIRSQPSGVEDHIEYIGQVNEYAQWSVQPVPEPGKSVMPGATAPSAPSGQDWLRQSLANGDLALVGPTRLGGRDAILLTYTEGSPGEVGYKQGKLWIDATSYLTLQNTVTMAGNTTTTVYDYLSPTAANQAMLWITPQPGWKRVSSDQLPRNLVS